MQRIIKIFNNSHPTQTYDFLSDYFHIEMSSRLTINTKLDNQYHLVIICCMLFKDEEAFQLCQEIKRHDQSQTVIIVSDQYDEIQAIKFFEMGADDYVHLPLHTREFVARLKAHLRRSSVDFLNITRISYGTLEVFPYQHKVNLDGEEVYLKNKEFNLLLFFIENRSKVLTRKELLCHLGSETISADFRLVDTYVSSLRNKLRLNFLTDRLNSTCYIKTVQGQGYIFDTYY